MSEDPYTPPPQKKDRDEEECEWDDWNDPDQPQPNDEDSWKDYKKWEAEQDHQWHSQDYQYDRYSQGSQHRWGNEHEWKNAQNPQSHWENSSWGHSWRKDPREGRGQAPARSDRAVSYTHLTLPTILLV